MASSDSFEITVHGEQTHGSIPWTGVDPISVGDIKKIILHLKERGIGILITDHNVRETLDVCEHAYIVSHGELIAEGDANQILANQHVRDVYLGEQFTL